jgi:hypothetical protein
MRNSTKLGRTLLPILMAVAFTAAPALVPAHAHADDTAGAKRAFDEGRKAYNIADYTRAIDYFKEGYSLSARAVFLYNIGRCYYQLANWEMSKFFFERYLSERDAEDADEVRSILVDIDEKIRGKGEGGPDSGDPDARPFAAPHRPPPSGDGDGDGDGWERVGGSASDARGADTDGMGLEPAAVADRASRPVLAAFSLGYLPTSRCGRLGGGGDCFLGGLVDVNIRVFSPSVLSLYVDVGGTIFTDFVEKGLAAGGGVRLRFDKWGLFVPYALATLNVGYGFYPGGGGSFRLWNRSAVGAELSLRNSAGHGVGLFAELGAGYGCCTTVYTTYGGIDHLTYAQYYVDAGVSF